MKIDQTEILTKQPWPLGHTRKTLPLLGFLSGPKIICHMTFRNTWFFVFIFYLYLSYILLLRLTANNLYNACCDWNLPVSVCFGPNCCNSELYATINVKSKICKTRINFHDALKWGLEYICPPRQTQGEKIFCDSQ